MQKMANQHGRHHRQRKPAWKLAQELPDFLDASASVSASTFGSRRLPEVKALWNAASNNTTSLIKSSSNLEEPLKSSGGKTSSRHLRRRTTSHKSRKRHRYPAAEVDRMHKRPKQLSDDDKDNAKEPSVSRRARRKRASILTFPHESWWKRQPKEGEESSGEAVVHTKSSDNTIKGKQQPLNWLTTHIWHSKRFHLAALWGWQIPMVHTNRGPKAALRLIREGKTLLQDATWYRAAQPIVLQVPLMGPLPQEEYEQSLQSALQRICPDFLLSFQSPGTGVTLSTTDVGVGQGMLYALDQFPRHAIGPITWLIRRGQPLMGGPGSTGIPQPAHYCYFWVPPVIHSEAWTEFEAIQNAWTSSPAPSLHNQFHAHHQTDTDVGVACFKLRGMNATNTVQKILDSSSRSPSGKDDNQLLLSDEKLHINLPHGTVISIRVAIGSSQIEEEEEEEEEARQTKIYHDLIRGRQVLLVSRLEAPEAVRNEPAIGWDFYCDATISRDLFVELVVKGNACPIGVVEEAYIKLECEPPMANTFPRDFPETRAGREYWQLQDSNLSDDNDNATTVDSTILRLCLEEGEKGGKVAVPTIKARSQPTASALKEQKRLKLMSRSLCKIHWYDDLINTSEDSVHDGEDAEEAAETSSDDADRTVVMMRGLFCKPVYDAIAASGTIAGKRASDEEHPPKRRRRRRVKIPSEVCHVTPLTRDESDKHLSTCTTLLRALSLPAVIACHVKVLGSGTIKPGSRIQPATTDTTESQALGFVTAASFSIGRGCSHGIGVVGASRLLETIIQSLSTPTQVHNGFAVVDSHGARRIQLMVHLVNGAATTKAALALLL